MSQSKHHRSSSETKGQRFARSFLAFALFLVLSALSLTVCARAVFINPQCISNAYTDEDYVTALHQDVLDYARDACRACALPEDTLDAVVSYDAVYKIENAYISGQFSSSEEFTKTTYQDYALELEKDILSAVKSTVKADKLTVDSNQKNGAKKLASKVSDYLCARVEIPHMDKIEPVYNIAKTACLAAIVALSVFALILALIVPSIGTKKYRALRSLVHSLTAAGLLNLLLIGGVEAVKHEKTLYIFPLYLRDMAMRYITFCEIAVGISSAVLFFIALILICVIWKMNRDSKN